MLCLHWERLWVGLWGLSWPVWLDVVDVTFTLEAKWAQIQELAAEGENPVKDWSWFPLALKELLQTFLWQVLSSGAWHGLCCPSLPLSPLFLSQSFHVLAALQV